MESTRSSGADRPLLFISHRQADQPIANVVRTFVNDRSGGRIATYQSSAPEAEGPRVGRELQRELKEALWRAGVIVLIFTSPDEDWSYCMWECGVATHPETPETKVIVFQCGPRPPSVYRDAVRVNVRDTNSMQRFVNEFLTSPDFFPDYREALAPGFSPNGDEVRDAARQLGDALASVLGEDTDEGDDWATVPFLRLQLTYAEVDRARELGDDVSAAHSLIREAARVSDIDAEAKRLFGLGRVDPLTPFAQLVEVWQQSWPGDSTWIEDLVEQLRVGGHWRRPRFGWQLMKSVDESDGARYAPNVSRVRSIPRQRCHQFDVYFSKFSTTSDGAIRIGFADQPQAGAG